MKVDSVLIPKETIHFFTCQELMMHNYLKIGLTLICCVAIFNPSFGKDKSKGWYPNAATGYWSFDLGYRGESYGGITSFNSGLFFETGINIGRFFHPELIASAFVGLAPVWGSSYSRSFSDAVNKYYEVPANYSVLQEKLSNGTITVEESRELDALETGINRMDLLMNQYPEGNVALYYGTAFRWPYRYAPIVKLYSLLYVTNMGSTNTSLYEIGGGPVQKARPFERYGFGIEVMAFRGYTIESSPAAGQFNAGYVSLFFEFLNLKEAKIYTPDDETDPVRNIYLNEFVSEQFFKEFGNTEIKIGIKIGMHLM